MAAKGGNPKGKDLERNLIEKVNLMRVRKEGNFGYSLERKELERNLWRK